MTKCGHSKPLYTNKGQSNITEAVIATGIGNKPHKATKGGWIKTNVNQSVQRERSTVYLDGKREVVSA